MNNRFFTLNKAPFLTITLFGYSLAFRYFEDLRKAPANSAEYNHALLFLVLFIFIGTFSIGLYIGFIIAERNIARNVEKNKRGRRG